nr:bacteriohemerythrin [uncultured Sulfurimonas sp.]
MQSVDIFPWNEHFSIGLDVVDAQHRKLVGILNKLATNIAYESSENDLSEIFDELSKYALYHFQTEEAIWNKYLPDTKMFKEHEEVHQKFIDRVAYLKSQEDHKPIAKLADEVLSFLAKWLASHILDADRNMAYIVFALQDGLSIEEAKSYACDKMGGSNRILMDIILSIYSTLSPNALSLMRELKAHRLFEKKANYQDSYKKLLLKLSTSFINVTTEQVDEAIKNSLESMATFVGVDRAYIFDYDIKNKTTSNTYEWCADKIAPKKDKLQNLSINIMLEWYEVHSKRKYVLIEDVLSMPEGNIKNLLLPQDIKSLLTIPLMQDDVCTGFVGFDAVKEKHEFFQDEIELLDLFAKLIANINNRKKMQEALSYEKNLLKTLIQTAPDLIWLKDMDGHYLTCNKRFEGFFGAKEEDIVGKSDYDFVDKELADFFRKNDNEAIQSDKLQVNEEEISFVVDGHKEILQTTRTAMRDSDGNLIGVLGVSRDITEYRNISNALKNERLMLEVILDNAPIGIWMSSSDGQMKFVNNTFCEATGISEEEFLSTKYANLLPEDVSPNCLKSDAECVLLESGVHISQEVIPFTDGQDHILEIKKVKVEVAEDEVCIVGLATDITQRQLQQKHLEYIAHYDALTGLANRVLFSDRMNQALAQSRRHKLSFGVVYIDLDGFKDINDSYGHEYGDKFLSLISEYMKKSLREGDTIARLGGDEFVVVLLDLKTHEDSVPMLNRLLEASSKKVTIDDIEMQVTASLGVTFFDKDDKLDADQLLRQADQAMYQAKLLGKNRYHIFDSLKDKKIRTHHESLKEIEMALLNDEFLLYYQPKVNMKTDEVIGAEALIRWNHPKRGILAPALFLPVIEGNILCVKLGEWVLDRAMKQIQEFKSKGINIPISINVDAMQLQQNNFIEQLKNLLVKYPTVKPTDVVLEILETSALEDIVHISQIMQTCREMGISFSLDDFGTGYSSLTYLKRLPAKELKIDQSFVRGMLEDSDDLAILDGVLGLSRAFRREVIAEGVETIEHGELLLKLGCEKAQGYAIARPMAPEYIFDWIKSYKTDEIWKNTLAISSDDLPLVYALTEHKAWIKSVLLYLEDKIRISPNLNHCECRFGEWLYESTQKSYEDVVEFQELEKSHLLMHKRINVIINNHQDGKKEDLATLKKEIKELSNNMIKSFKKFESKRKKML